MTHDSHLSHFDHLIKKLSAGLFRYVMLLFYPFIITVDPWTSRVWIAWVQLHVDYFSINTVNSSYRLISNLRIQLTRDWNSTFAFPSTGKYCFWSRVGWICRCGCEGQTIESKVILRVFDSVGLMELLPLPSQPQLRCSRVNCSKHFVRNYFETL